MSLAIPDPATVDLDRAALAPLMASDPDLTVADAMRRRLGKAA